MRLYEVEVEKQGCKLKCHIVGSIISDVLNTAELQFGKDVEITNCKFICYMDTLTITAKAVPDIKIVY